ncbi:hypothetical protein [Labedaea rhizosphaerae]|uniref:Uncharacterized protein n=1 Tax=Labedaea rhizosphaerae TaxID=598644 RepID=A0A4R6SE11_LABRH|nr:hypothetical protein [Labedaea rhizosphaerae]TDP97355.1 hypothetical protein EV186_103319 [Labedaea rhizosphaerae]
MTYPQQALPREFRMAGGGFGRIAAPWIAALVFFTLIMLVLGSVVGGIAGGIIAAVVGDAILLGILYSKYNRLRQGTVVQFSEHGVQLSDHLGFHMSLLWQDIDAIGPVATQMGDPRSVGVRGGAQVSVGAVHSLGLIGWGHRIVPPNAPRWMRELLATAPRHPVDGRQQVAIPLGGIDPNWTQGPMGQWVLLYRPDLFGRQAS